MSALNPQRRAVKASAIAKQYGVTERAVRNLIAEPRYEFLNRAQERHDNVVNLRAQGLKIREIAEILNINLNTVGSIIRKAKLSGKLTLHYAVKSESS